MLFKALHKSTTNVVDVYDIRYVGNQFPSPFFLVYIQDTFKLVAAHEFEPYDKDLKKGSKRPLFENIINTKESE